VSNRQPMVQAYVEHMLSRVLAKEHVHHRRGEWQIRHNTAHIHICVIGEPENPRVRIWAPLVHNIASGCELLDVLNITNAELTQGRVYWQNSTVLIATDLHWLALDEPAFHEIRLTIADVAHSLGCRLVAHFGGETAFPPIEADEQDDGYELCCVYPDPQQANSSLLLTARQLELMREVLVYLGMIATERDGSGRPTATDIQPSLDRIIGPTAVRAMLAAERPPDAEDRTTKVLDANLWNRFFNFLEIAVERGGFTIT